MGEGTNDSRNRSRGRGGGVGVGKGCDDLKLPLLPVCDRMERSDDNCDGHNTVTYKQQRRDNRGSDWDELEVTSKKSPAMNERV